MCITSLSIGLRWLVPPNPGYNSTHDDQLLVTLARNILNNEWLGSYQEMGHLLLSKPPGYSMFLAYTHWLPWAPTVSIHILLLSGFLLVAREMRAQQASRSLCVAIYLLFAFYPVWFSETMSRLYRDGLLAALTTIFVGLSLILRRQIREGAKFRYTISTSISIGFLIGLFYITKPSWHFLVPIFFGFILIGDLRVLIRDRHLIRHRAKVTSLAFFTVIISFLLLPGYVIVQNENHYGISAIDSFSQGSFPEAMKAIYSATEPVNRPYIDSTSRARADLYRVSPTMKSLEYYLELPVDQGWRSQPCHSELGVCDESGAWFPWEFRDAIEKSGQGKTAKEFEKTAQNIAREIRSACQKKIIVCQNEGLAPGLDSLDTLSPKSLVDSFAKGIQFLVDPMTGYQERGEAVNIDSKTIDIWEETIRGLPPRLFATKYESNDLFLGDIRLTLIQVYKSFWILLILFAACGILLARRLLEAGIATDLRICAVSILAGVSVLILQISMLQASSGYYMNSGGNLYLLPLHPTTWIFVLIGVHRLWLILQELMRGRGSEKF